MKKTQNSFGAVCALTVLLTVAALCSCEKAVFDDNDAAGAAGGNLRVKVFEIEKTPFASLTRAGGEAAGAADATRAEQAAAEVCTRLNFAVYDEASSRLKQVNQTSDKAGFGQCAFQLDEGTYQLVVVGHSAKSNPTMTNLSKIQFTNATGYTDTFMCYGEVTVGEEAVDYEVALDRIVALCRFVVTDDFPADVATMQFYYTGGSGAFDALTGLGSVASKQTVTFDVTGSQKQFDLYTFLHEVSDNIALKVTALDAGGNMLYERDFDVPMEQNHITWLSGAYFSGSGSSATTVTSVTVDTDWAGETHLAF